MEYLIKSFNCHLMLHVKFKLLDFNFIVIGSLYNLVHTYVCQSRLYCFKEYYFCNRGLFDPQMMFAELKNIYIFVQMAWHFVRW